VFEHQPFWYLLILVSYSINSEATKTPENREEDPDNPGPEDEGDIQTKYSLD
jgi:hypothetical protein